MAAGTSSQLPTCPPTAIKCGLNKLLVGRPFRTPFSSENKKCGLEIIFFLQRASLSPGEQAARERERLNNRAHSPEHKKLKRSLNNNEEASDGEKSDADLVVDDANEGPAGAANGNHHSPRENGIDGKKSPRSPGSESSSGGKKKEDSGKKSSLRSTPTAKPLGNVPQMPSKIKRKEFYFYQQNVGYTVSVIVLIH